MMKWFRGIESYDEIYDFKTATTYYEVKSCLLLTSTSNRDREGKRHKHEHIGRFYIKHSNHDGLKIAAERDGKKFKYIFVIVIEKTLHYKIVEWSKVDALLNRPRRYTNLRIKDIFKVMECLL